MNHDPSKLRHQHRQQEEFDTQSIQKPGLHEFASVDDLIRYDAAQTPVPETIGTRLNDSINDEPKRTRNWWRRLFARGA